MVFLVAYGVEFGGVVWVMFVSLVLEGIGVGLKQPWVGVLSVFILLKLLDFPTHEIVFKQKGLDGF